MCKTFQLKQCESPVFWINKISRELDYSSNFIKEYVYDNQTNTMKTLMPLNEKYLER